MKAKWFLVLLQRDIFSKLRTGISRIGSNWIYKVCCLNWFNEILFSLSFYFAFFLLTLRLAFIALAYFPSYRLILFNIFLFTSSLQKPHWLSIYLHKIPMTNLKAEKKKEKSLSCTLFQKNIILNALENLPFDITIDYRWVIPAHTLSVCAFVYEQWNLKTKSKEN